MSGYVIAFGACCVCERVMGFNPNKVPSVPINGIREPVCQSCIEIANPERVKRGLAPIVPHPDAYASIPEEEL